MPASSCCCPGIMIDAALETQEDTFLRQESSFHCPIAPQWCKPGQPVIHNENANEVTSLQVNLAFSTATEVQSHQSSGNQDLGLYSIWCWKSFCPILLRDTSLCHGTFTSYHLAWDWNISTKKKSKIREHQGPSHFIPNYRYSPMLRIDP